MKADPSLPAMRPSDLALALLVIAVWGVNFAVIKVGVVGVPPLLLGLPGDNTHANFQEANRAFWRQTLIPLVRRTQKSVETWLAPSFPGARIEADLDGLDALAAERETEWRRVGAASFLSDDEKRAALGYGPLARKHSPRPAEG